MAFYRIYRPQVFDEIDNGFVREQLELLLTKKKSQLPHAFLFTGPKGTGKTTAARLIAKLFTCQKPLKSNAPCGTCGTCKGVANGSYIDLLELDAASNRGIDEIRSLRDTIALAPSIGEFKIYIIDEVHMLTTEAFNALLKTLEEPPPHAVFILATTELQKVPSTIISRCVHIQFAKADQKDLLHALKRVIKKEKISIDDDALVALTDRADGSFRDGVKLLEQVSFQKGTISLTVVQNTLTIPSAKVLERFEQQLFAKNAIESLATLDALVGKGTDMKSFLISVLSRFEHELIEHVKGNASTHSKSELQRAIRLFTRAYEELRVTPIAQLPIELAVIEFCEDGSVKTFTEIEDSSLPQKKDISQSNNVQSAPPSKDESHDTPRSSSLGLITLEKLNEHWKDVIESMKPYNHSIAGVLRSARPKAVESGIVTIEAFYLFHKEKLSEGKTREELANILKKLFGERVKVEVVLGKK